MLTPLFWLAAGLAVTDWTVVARQQKTSRPNQRSGYNQLRWSKQLRWFTKPAVMLAMIAWFFSLGGWHMPLLLFGAGLALSLLGDVLLMLPERYFLGGVAAFLLAHLCYIFSFLHGSLPPFSVALVAIIPAAAAFVLLLGRIRTGMRTNGQLALFGPVVGYALVLSAMWAAALSTLLRPDWPLNAALLCSLGGSLFFVSDSLLAYSRFVRPIRRGDLLVMITYHSGQALLAAGMLLQYGGLISAV